MTTRGHRSAIADTARSARAALVGGQAAVPPAEGSAIPADCAAACALRRGSAPAPEHQDKERAESLHPWPATGLVFVSVVGTPIDPNNFSRTFARWCREAKVPVVRLHDLRHTCVSLLLSLGVPPRVVMKIVGHAAIEMTMNVYGHVALDDQRAALDLLNGLLDD